MGRTVNSCRCCFSGCDGGGGDGGGGVLGGVGGSGWCDCDNDGCGVRIRDYEIITMVAWRLVFVSV